MSRSATLDMSVSDSSEFSFSAVSGVWEAEDPSTKSSFGDDAFGAELHGLLVKLLKQRSRMTLVDLGTTLQAATGNTWLLALINQQYGSLEQFLRNDPTFQLGLDSARALVVRLASREARHAAKRSPEPVMYQDEVEALKAQVAAVQISTKGTPLSKPLPQPTQPPQPQAPAQPQSQSNEQAKLVEIIADLLREHGHLSVANIGTRLHRLVSAFTFNLIKERYGGLKRFLTQQGGIFEIARDHPFDPTIRLSRTNSTSLPRALSVPLSISAPSAAAGNPPVFPDGAAHAHVRSLSVSASDSDSNNENAIIRKVVVCAVQILRNEGPQTVLVLSGRLDASVGVPQLPALIKRRFGGLKAFFCMQPAFVVHEDPSHSFNAVVALRDLQQDASVVVERTPLLPTQLRVPRGAPSQSPPAAEHVRAMQPRALPGMSPLADSQAQQQLQHQQQQQHQLQQQQQHQHQPQQQQQQGVQHHFLGAQLPFQLSVSGSGRQ